MDNLKTLNLKENENTIKVFRTIEKQTGTLHKFIGFIELKENDTKTSLLIERGGDNGNRNTTT